MSDLRPADGARYLLERVDDRNTSAEYRAVIYTPTAEYITVAQLFSDGRVDAAPSGAPDELDATLLLIAKLIARGTDKRRADGLAVWPTRILRWRGPGRGH